MAARLLLTVTFPQEFSTRLWKTTPFEILYNKPCKENGTETLVLHGKIDFSVEKYVGNVDNFSLIFPVENSKNRKMIAFFRQE